LIFLHFELLTCDIYNCVHSVERLIPFTVKGTQK